MINWFEKHSKISFLFCIFVGAFIFYVSSLSFEKENTITAFKSILYHFTIYFVFSFFISISLVKGKYSRRYFLILALFLSILYAISDEIHQYFVPNRSMDFRDILIDSIGSLSLTIIYAFRLNNKKN